MKKITHARTLHGTWHRSYISNRYFANCNQLVTDEIKATVQTKEVQAYISSLLQSAHKNKAYINLYILTYQTSVKVCRNNKIKDLLRMLYADYQQFSKSINAPNQITQAVKQTIKDVNIDYMQQYHNKSTHKINMWTARGVKAHIGQLLTYNPNKSLSFFADLLHVGLATPLNSDGLTVWAVAESSTSLLDLRNRLTHIATDKRTKHNYSKTHHKLIEDSIYQMTVNGLRRVFKFGAFDALQETDKHYTVERTQNALQFMYQVVSNYIYNQRSADTISLQSHTAKNLTLADLLQDTSDPSALQEYRTYVDIINGFYNTYNNTIYVKPKTFAIYCQYLTLKCTGLPDYQIYNKIGITNKPLQKYKSQYGTMFLNYVKHK